MPVDGGPQRGPRRPASAASAPRDVRMQVAVRVRPDADSAVLVDATDVSLASKKDVVYSFDQVFSGGQEEVYAAYGKPMMDDAVDGYNTCLFAYGQTGSGKTYTLLGMPGAGLPAGADADAAAHGLLPRFLEDVAAYRQRKMVQNPAMQITLAMSVLEIYNEDLRDLLRPKPADGAKPAAPPCLVQDQETKETVVSGAAEIPIDSGAHALSLLRMGVASRQTAATDMNDVSSRSHMIVLVTLKQQQPDGAATIVSNIRFVDLAGSECLAQTKAKGMRQEEGRHINQSLLALGKALKQFAAGKSKEEMKGMLRESKLTHLLSENFGGNSKTRMLAMVSPLVANEQQTVSTLSYALRAKNITLHAKLNRRTDAGRVQQLEKALHETKAEVERLVQEASQQQEKLTDIEEQLTQAAAARASLEELRQEEELHAEEVEDLTLKEAAALQRALHLVRAAEEAGATAADPAQPPAKRRRTKVLAPKREVEQQVQRKISTTQPTTAELTQEYLKGDLQQEVLKVEATEQRRQAAVRGNHALQSEVARLQNELRAAKAENVSLRGLLDKAKPNDSAPPPPLSMAGPVAVRAERGAAEADGGGVGGPGAGAVLEATPPAQTAPATADAPITTSSQPCPQPAEPRGAPAAETGSAPPPPCPEWAAPATWEALVKVLQAALEGARRKGIKFVWKNNRKLWDGPDALAAVCEEAARAAAGRRSSSGAKESVRSLMEEADWGQGLAVSKRVLQQKVTDWEKGKGAYAGTPHESRGHGSGGSQMPQQEGKSRARDADTAGDATKRKPEERDARTVGDAVDDELPAVDGAVPLALPAERGSFEAMSTDDGPDSELSGLSMDLLRPSPEGPSKSRSLPQSQSEYGAGGGGPGAPVSVSTEAPEVAKPGHAVSPALPLASQAPATGGASGQPDAFGALGVQQRDALAAAEEKAAALNFSNLKFARDPVEGARAAAANAQP